MLERGYIVTDTQKPFSAVFQQTGSGVDYSPFVRGNMMHEIGHLVDHFTSPRPSASGAWTTALNSTRSAMLGSWPGTQSPTCMQVFNQTPFVCGPNPNKSPYQILTDIFIQGQNEEQEVFAIAFQNCSGYEQENLGGSGHLGLQNASRSTYMRSVYNYMDQVFWPTGCTWVP